MRVVQQRQCFSTRSGLSAYTFSHIERSMVRWRARECCVRVDARAHGTTRGEAGTRARACPRKLRRNWPPLRYIGYSRRDVTSLRVTTQMHITCYSIRVSTTQRNSPGSRTGCFSLNAALITHSKSGSIQRGGETRLRAILVHAKIRSRSTSIGNGRA